MDFKKIDLYKLIEGFGLESIITDIRTLSSNVAVCSNTYTNACKEVYKIIFDKMDYYETFDEVINTDKIGFLFLDETGEPRIKYDFNIPRGDFPNDSYVSNFDASSIPITVEDLEVNVEKSKGYLVLNLFLDPFLMGDILVFPCFAYIKDDHSIIKFIDIMYRVYSSMVSYNNVLSTKNVFKLDDNDAANVMMFGNELEFMAFNNKTDNYNLLTSIEGSSSQENKKNYLSLMSSDSDEFFSDVIRNLVNLGIKIDNFHKEVAPNQYEISFKYTLPHMLLYNNIMTRIVLYYKCTEYEFGVLYGEKPSPVVNGNGSHLNVSIGSLHGSIDDCIYENFLTDEMRQSLSESLIINSIIKYKDEYLSLVDHESNLERFGEMEAPPFELSFDLSDRKNRNCSVVKETNRFEFRLHGTCENIGITLSAMMYIICLYVKEAEEVEDSYSIDIPNPVKENPEIDFKKEILKVF